DRDGKIVLIDEVHTPDSSRFWKLDSYQARVAEGLEPELFDKEYVRMVYSKLGYRGDGEVPEVPESVWETTSGLYRTIYEKLTGLAFVPGEYPVGPRLESNLRSKGIIQ
ncbi:MAG: phosphoribosylaminoimidazolesuccinocarboxamide synthase, partial [Rectinemataceae bacterium]|nr:phosphoribosylaminoimidazolesuccinocarboxamide synthase [Rectinemataceae bacterium]